MLSMLLNQVKLNFSCARLSLLSYGSVLCRASRSLHDGQTKDRHLVVNNCNGFPTKTQSSRLISRDLSKHERIKKKHIISAF